MTELERLQALMDAEQVKLGVNIRQMNSPGSPVFNAWENIWLPAGSLLLSFLAVRFVNLYLGFAILAAGSAWWLMKVQPKVNRDVFDRTAAIALRDPAMFDALWAKGVLSLYARLPDGTERAATRKDDWRAFIRSLPEA